jgi:hypothetical protein
VAFGSSHHCDFCATVLFISVVIGVTSEYLPRLKMNFPESFVLMDYLFWWSSVSLTLIRAIFSLLSK